MVNASTYSTDAIKIAVLASYLTGPALTWLNPYLENQAKHAYALSSYANFCVEMDAFFQPVDRVTMAAMRLNELLMKPGQSVSEFSSLLLQLSSDVNWNEAALMSHYDLALSSQIADMMVMHDECTSLKDMMSLAIKLDGCFRLNQQQRTHRRPAPSHDRPGPRIQDRLGQRIQDRLAPRPKVTFSVPPSDAMDLDAATVK